MKTSGSLVKKFMIFSGMFSEKYVDPSLKRIYFVYKYFFQVCFALAIASLTIESVRISKYPYPLERKMQAFMISIAASTVLVKLIVYKKNDVPKMFEEIVIIEKDMALNKNKEVQRMYQQFQKYNFLIIISVIVVTNCTVSFMLIASVKNIFKTGLKNFDYQNDALFIELYFPDIIREKHVYIIFLTNIYFPILGFIANVAGQTTLYTLVNFASFKFKLIGYYLRTFRSFRSTPQDNPFLRLRFIIIEHQKTIKYVENLNTAIKYVILYEFLINSVNVASIAFQLITVSDYTKLTFAVIFFCLQVNQIFILAITANEVQVQSVAVATNAYNSNWHEEYNKEIRQMMSMIILRAQKPAELTIGPFTPMTTDTAITVMKAAYSYVTLMVDFLGKK